ncbi:MAG: hypothetical protein ABIG95_00045 [Candidatus Woesearchaeota archaeon]
MDLAEIIKEYGLDSDLAKVLEHEALAENNQSSRELLFGSKSLGSRIAVLIQDGLVNGSRIEPRFYSWIYLDWLMGLEADEIASRLGIERDAVLHVMDTAGLSASGIVTPKPRLDNPREKYGDSSLKLGLDALGKSKVVAVMGTSPTGNLHLGNVYTFVAGATRVQKICSELGIDVEFVLGINDLLISEIAISGQDRVVVLKYEQKSLVEEFTSAIDRVLGALYDHTGIEVRVEPFSVTQARARFRAVLERERQLGGFSPYTPYNITLAVVCGNCNRPVITEMDGNRTLDVGVTCKTTGCGNTLKPDFDDYSLEFASDTIGIMVLRDMALGADIHIFGGDYRGSYRFTAYTKEGKSMRYTLPYCVGTVYGFDGKEMHKSDNNGLDARTVLASPDWINTILLMAQRGDLYVDAMQYFDV